MLDDYCVSVVNKCFLALYCVEFGTNSEVTTLPCIKKLVYGFIFQIKRPLVFPGVSFLFFAELEETHSPACYFLPGQTSKIYGQRFFFFFLNYGGLWEGQGAGSWCGLELVIGQPVLELMCDSACTCHHA